MIAYAALMVIFFGMGAFYRTRFDDKKRTTKYMITTFFVVYLFLLCFRATSVGIDTINYVNRYFYPFYTMSWREVFMFSSDEPGFSIFVKLISVITTNEQIFMSLAALVAVVPVMVLYRRESREAAVCCSFFMISLLFEFFFSGMRQSIAVGLAVPAYYFAKSKRIVPFLLIVALAATFHISAIMMLFIYPIYHAKITGKWLWIVVPVMGLIFYYNRQIFTVLFELVGGKYFEKYSTLYGSTNQYGLLILFVLLSAYSIFMMDSKIADEDDIGLRNILLLATVIQCFAPLHNIVSRMNYYYILFIPIAITRANQKCKHRYWQITKVASCVMTAYFIFYFFFSKGDTLHIMNYSFCF